MTIGVSIGTGDRPPPATWCRIAAASAQTLDRLGMGTRDPARVCGHGRPLRATGVGVIGVTPTYRPVLA